MQELLKALRLNHLECEKSDFSVENRNENGNDGNNGSINRSAKSEAINHCNATISLLLPMLAANSLKLSESAYGCHIIKFILKFGCFQEYVEIISKILVKNCLYLSMNPTGYLVILDFIQMADRQILEAIADSFISESWMILQHEYANYVIYAILKKNVKSLRDFALKEMISGYVSTNNVTGEMNLVTGEMNLVPVSTRLACSKYSSHITQIVVAFVFGGDDENMKMSLIDCFCGKEGQFVELLMMDLNGNFVYQKLISLCKGKCSEHLLRLSMATMLKWRSNIGDNSTVGKCLKNVIANNNKVRRLLMG